MCTKEEEQRAREEQQQRRRAQQEQQRVQQQEMDRQKEEAEKKVSVFSILTRFNFQPSLQDAGQLFVSHRAVSVHSSKSWTDRRRRRRRE